MTPKKAKRICDEWLPIFRWALQLQKWSFKIRYERMTADSPDDTKAGDVVSDTQYRTVLIRLDPGACDSKKELLDFLLHEMIHVFHAEIGPLGDCLDAMCSAPEKEVLVNLLAEVKEGVVRRVLNMLTFGLGISHKQMKKLSEGDH